MRRAMTSLRRRTLLLAAVAVLAAGLPAGAAPASATIEGTIIWVTRAGLTIVTASGGRTSVVTDPATRVFNLTPAALHDIKVGDFVGVTARKEPSGSLTAVEIHIFPASLRGRVHEGQFPMATGNLMTNATVMRYVSRVSGRTITLTYPGGTTTIAVPPSTPVRRLTVGSLEELRAGMHVTVRVAAGRNGGLTASSIAVEPAEH